MTTRGMLLNVLVLATVGAQLLSDPTVVDLPDGPVKCTLTGNRSRQCLGLPYAAPPLGLLRWAPPQPPSNWSKLRDATRQMDACYQRGRGCFEDCLNLNVFAPRQPPPAGSPGYPVVIYIHGGSYSTGTL
jgi:para-nitrobenzyl esterase